MSINSKAIRLFISSTFSDFDEERDILHGEIFPRLSMLCNSYGYTFQPVDLRWGITQQTAEEQKTLQICLREVQRSIEVSPRPNFLILLGDRYGWQPLPHQIPMAEFERISARLSGLYSHTRGKAAAAKSLLSRWYKLDKNAVPPEYFLLPRHGIDNQEWGGIECRIRQIFREATARWDQGKTAWMRYHLSATAFEISEAVFEGAAKQKHDIKEHIFCFHRQRFSETPNHPVDPDQRYDDLVGTTIDEDATHLRHKFQQRLRVALGRNYISYPSFARSGQLVNNHLRAFADDVYLLLERIVRKQLQEATAVSPLEQEIAVHESFLADRASNFVGRIDLVRKILASVNAGATTHCVLHGRGGSGKSSLMAFLSNYLKKDEQHVCCRFLGLSAASSGGVALLESMSRQLAVMGGVDLKNKVHGFNGWRDEFKRLLYVISEATATPIFVVIDALDQLPAEDPVSALDWIPDSIKGNVRILLTTTPGPMLERLRNRIPNATYIEVTDVGASDGKALLQQLLFAHKRTLRPAQSKYVLERFSHDPIPLYLRIATEETRHWRAWDPVPRDQQELPATSEKMIQRVLENLASPTHHGRILVTATMSLLGAARYGLTEVELMDLLSRNAAVMAEARNATPKGAGLSKFPFIYWSRLRDELSPFLTERDADGQAVISFFHRIFNEAIQKKYLGVRRIRHAVHCEIADYFILQSNFHDEQRMRPNRRKLTELPYQLIEAGRNEDLLNLLLQREYFDAKNIAGHQSELLAEYRECFVRFVEAKHVRQAIKSVNALARHLLLAAFDRPGTVDIEDVHAELGFQRDNRFYAKVLEAGIRIGSDGKLNKHRNVRVLILGMQAREANIWRRNGQLKRAKRRLLNILPQIQRWAPASEVARVQYDLGYIAYLEGDFDKSMPLFELSAQTSKRGGNDVGFWISRCVSEHNRWLLDCRAGRSASANLRFERNLNKAMRVFDRNKHLDSTSARWVMNVYAHRFSIAYRQGNVDVARELSQHLRQDPWLAKFSDELFFLRLDARMDMLDGDFSKAAIKLRRYVDRRRSHSLLDESLAEDYLDLGLAYLHCGNRSNACNAWREGISLPYNAGNSYWQEIISELLKNSQFATSGK